MPLITTGVQTPITAGLDTINSALNHLPDGTGNNVPNLPQVYDATANSYLTGSGDPNGGITLENGANLTMVNDTLLTNRIVSSDANATNHVVFDATDSLVLLTGNNSDTLNTARYPANSATWNLNNNNANLTGTIRLTRTNLFSTFANTVEGGNENGGPLIGNNGGNGLTLRCEFEDSIIGPLTGGSLRLSFGGMDSVNSFFTRVTFRDGVNLFLPRIWNSVDTTLLATANDILRVFRGTAGYGVFSQLDVTSSGATAFIDLDGGTDVVFLNPVLNSSGITLMRGQGGGGEASSVYQGVPLSTRFTDLVTGSFATDSFIKFEGNRTFTRGTTFDIASALPTIRPAAVVASGEFRSDADTVGYSDTEATNGIVLLGDVISENATVANNTNLGSLTNITTAPQFKAWSYTHNVPFLSTLNSFTRTGADGNDLTLFGTQISSDDPNVFVATETYAGVEDEFVKNASGTVVAASTYLVNTSINDTLARTDYQMQNLQELYRTMKALWYTQRRDIDFTTAVSVDDDLNLVLSGDFSLNASGNRAFWHGSFLNRFAIGRDTTGTPLAAVPGVLEGIVVQGELPLPNNATTLTSSVSSATDDITGIPFSVGSADARISVSAGGALRFQDTTSTVVFNNVDIPDGNFRSFPSGSSFTNCTVAAGVQISDSSSNPTGSFTLDGGTYAFTLQNLAAGNHTWTINNNPTLSVVIPATPNGTITINTDNSITRDTVNLWLAAQGATVLSSGTGNGYFVPEPVLTYDIAFPGVAGNYIIRNNGATFASGTTGNDGVTIVEISNNQYTDPADVTLYWTAESYFDVAQVFTGMDVTIGAVGDPNVADGSFSGAIAGAATGGVATFTGTTSTSAFAGTDTNLWWNRAKSFSAYTEATVAYRELSDSNTTPLIQLVSASNTSVNGDHIRFAASVTEQQLMTNLVNTGTAGITSSISLNASQIAFQTAGSYTSVQAQADFSSAGLSTDNSTRAIIDEELDAGKLTRVGRPS